MPNTNQRDKHDKLLIFAKEFAKYSTSAERSNDLISDIGKILGRELNQEEQFTLRINIITFISSSVIWCVSLWNEAKVRQDRKDVFLFRCGERVRDIFQIFGDWSPEQLQNYANLGRLAAELYHQSLAGKKAPKQKDLNHLWDNFAHSTMMGLNFGAQINSENGYQYNLLLKVIKLKLASLHNEVLKKLDANIELFEN